MPFGRAQREGAVPDKRSSGGYVSSCPEARLFPLPGGAPPPSPLLGPWPVRQLLGSSPARVQNQLFPFLSRSPPVSPPAPPLSCLSFLAICSWISLRWASPGLPGQPRHSIACPVPSQVPQPPPCPGYIRFFPDSKSAQHFPPFPSLCVELCC